MQDGRQTFMVCIAREMSLLVDWFAGLLAQVRDGSSEWW